MSIKDEKTVENLSKEDGNNINKIFQFLVGIWQKVNGDISNFFGTVAGLIDKYGCPSAIIPAMILLFAELHFDECNHIAPNKKQYAYQQLLECIDASAKEYGFESMMNVDEEGIDFFNFFPKYGINGDVTEPMIISAQLRYINKKLNSLQKRKDELLIKSKNI
ncbi:MAG: hypothetical protein WC934_02860 [Acidithiobacillus sp.]|jgi:hypothetical protein|uniref:hypothetical protein n=1 Tax=Acidithiobacillus sp. TaxID=1872118 RepID=UPI00355E9C79